MQPKKKKCYGCDLDKYIWKNFEGNKYCSNCWNSIRYATEGPTFKQITPPKKKSKKQEGLDRAYSMLRTPFMEKHPECQAGLDGCSFYSTDVHHIKGRGKWLLIVAKWMAVCRHCHDWIEANPIEATEMGFRESKVTD